MKLLLLPASVWVVFSLELAIAPSVLARLQTQLQPSIPSDESNYRKQISDNLPPPPENPSRTTGGGRRDRGLCPQDADTLTLTQSLIALSPMTESGLTLAERPTFLVFVPQTTAQTVEFSLFDQNNKGIYQTTFALTNTPGIVSFTLPSNAPSLEIGKNYTWFFALICDPKNRRRDQLVRGEIQRTQLDSAQLREIEQALPQERISLYRKIDVWYEALSTLFDLQRSQPNDPNLAVTWKELLQSGGLDPAAVELVGE